MIRNLTQTFTAGEAKIFEISGSYIEILSCTNPITVWLEDRNGVPISRMENAAASYYIKLSESDAKFARVIVKSDTAQSVSLVLADGEAGTRTMAGVIRVVDEYAANAVKNKCFISTAYDKPMLGTRNFGQVALVNSGSSDLLIQKIQTCFRLEGSSASLKVDGSLRFDIENNEATRFSFQNGRSTEGFKNLGSQLKTSVGCLLTNMATNAAFEGGILSFVPDVWGCASLDLELTPIILSAGQRLVVTHTNDDSGQSGYAQFSALFCGRVVGGDLVPQS